MERNIHCEIEFFSEKEATIRLQATPNDSLGAALLFCFFAYRQFVKLGQGRLTDDLADRFLNTGADLGKFVNKELASDPRLVLGGKPIGKRITIDLQGEDDASRIQVTEDLPRDRSANVFHAGALVILLRYLSRQHGEDGDFLYRLAAAASEVGTAHYARTLSATTERQQSRAAATHLMTVNAPGSWKPKPPAPKPATPSVSIPPPPAPPPVVPPPPPKPAPAPVIPVAPKAVVVPVAKTKPVPPPPVEETPPVPMAPEPPRRVEEPPEPPPKAEPPKLEPPKPEPKPEPPKPEPAPAVALIFPVPKPRSVEVAKESSSLRVDLPQVILGFIAGAGAWLLHWLSHPEPDEWIGIAVFAGVFWSLVLAVALWRSQQPPRS